MTIFCISGKAQHGKDTTANLLKEQLEDDGYSVLIAHYGDLVKYVCQRFHGWDGNKDEYGRTLLQYVGTDVIRQKDENYWVRFVSDMLRFFPNEWDYVLIPDCRFPNEVELMRQTGHTVKHLRVVRPDFDNGLTPEQKKHPSETALDEVMPDHIIRNNGSIEDLQNAVTALILLLNGRHQMGLFSQTIENIEKNEAEGGLA